MEKKSFAAIGANWMQTHAIAYERRYHEMVQVTETMREIGAFGVVGVACVLTLLSGFEKTLPLKLPTQGVFLSYSSCGHHWADPGYNTSFSLKRLGMILGKEIDSDPEPPSNRGETYSFEKRLMTPDMSYRTLDNLIAMFETLYLPAFRAANPTAAAPIPFADVFAHRRTSAPRSITASASIRMQK